MIEHSHPITVLQLVDQVKSPNLIERLHYLEKVAFSQYRPATCNDFHTIRTIATVIAPPQNQ